LTSSWTSDEAKGHDEASAPLKAACFAEHTDRMRVVRASFTQQTQGRSKATLDHCSVLDAGHALVLSLWKSQ
jgi:hypothetical protein